MRNVRVVVLFLRFRFLFISLSIRSLLLFGFSLLRALVLCECRHCSASEEEDEKKTSDEIENEWEKVVAVNDQTDLSISGCKFGLHYFNEHYVEIRNDNTPLFFLTIFWCFYYITFKE